MITKNKKLISVLLIILIIVPAILFSRPKQAQAQWYSIVDPGAIWTPFLVHDAGQQIAHTSISTIAKIILGIQTGSTLINTGHTVVNAGLEVLKQTVMIIEKQALQSMTKSITGWINNGFHGSPLFLMNSDSFFHDIAKTEIKTLVNEFGYDPNRFPFGQAFALNTINAYKRAADADAAYSLSAVMTDPIMLRNYQNNFNTGGWNGFLINTQYPQNNYLGFQMLATDQLARQLQGTTQNAAQKITTTLNQGLGFLSPQTCPSNSSYNNGYNEFNRPAFVPPTISETGVDFPDPVYPKDENGNPNIFATPTNQAQIDAASAEQKLVIANAKATWAKANTCPGGLVATTPGSVAANQIFTALGVDVSKTALGTMVEGSLSAILNTLVSH